MPNARRRAATAWPIRPKPTMPSCLPRSSRAEHEVERPPLPAAAPNQPIAFGDAPRDAEDQRPGEIGGRLGQHVRRVGDDDAALARRGDVDVVVADGDVRNDLQVAAGVDHRAVDRVGQQRMTRRLLAGSARISCVRATAARRSLRSTSHGASSVATAHAREGIRRGERGRLRLRPMPSSRSVAVRLAVAAVVARHGGLDDARPVRVGAGGNGKQRVAGVLTIDGECAAGAAAAGASPRDRPRGARSRHARARAAPVRSCRSTSTLSTMPMIAASTGAPLRPSASPAARPSITTSTFS